MFKKFLSFRAPASWHFTEPTTLQSFEAGTKEELIKKILNYLKQNDLPEIPLLDQTIENFLCGFPENKGKCGRDGDIPRGFWQTIKAGITILKKVLIDNPVTQEVADKRAKICLTCPHNVFPKNKSRFQAWSDKLAEASVPGKRVYRASDLGTCEVCTCPLRVKTWLYGPFDLSKEQQEKMKVVSCWQILQ